MSELLKYSLVMVLVLLLHSCGSDSTTKQKEDTTETSNSKVTACEIIQCQNALEIKVANNELFALRNIKSKNGVISRLKFPDKKWNNLPGKDFQSFVVSKSGQIYGIKNTKTKKGIIVFTDGKKWKKLPGSDYNSIALDGSDSLYAITKKKNKNEIVRWKNDKWETLYKTTNIKNLLVKSPDEIYVIKGPKLTGSIHKLENKNLVKVSKSGIQDFTIHNGNITAIKNTKNKGDLAMILNNEGKWKNLTSRETKSIDFDDKYIYTLEVNKSDKTYIRKCLSKS